MFWLYAFVCQLGHDTISVMSWVVSGYCKIITKCDHKSGLFIVLCFLLSGSHKENEMQT